MLMSDHENHRRFRQLFSPAFSDRALKKQEPLFQKYTDRLVATIDKVAAEGKPMDMVLMYNLATFDMMGDFTFGQSLGMLEKVEYNPWLKTVFEYVKLWPFAQIIQTSPLLETLGALLEPKSIATMRDSHFKYTADRVNKRLPCGVRLGFDMLTLISTRRSRSSSPIPPGTYWDATCSTHCWADHRWSMGYGWDTGVSTPLHDISIPGELQGSGRVRPGAMARRPGLRE